jgi:molybdopterin-guanine dinucleotide biosynthesis protein A
VQTHNSEKASRPDDKGAAKASFAIIVLAGGMSTRMGRDKSRLRLGRRSLLGHVLATARELGCQVRVIRRDLVPRCGPLGGIFTGLKTSSAEAELFLACDMPFVPTRLLMEVLRGLGARRKAVFTTVDATPGFPFALRASALPVVERQIRRGQFSLRALAKALKAKPMPVPRGFAKALSNINTPLDWQAAQASRRDASKPRPLGSSGRARRPR